MVLFTSVSYFIMRQHLVVKYQEMHGLFALVKTRDPVGRAMIIRAFFWQWLLYEVKYVGKLFGRESGFALPIMDSCLLYGGAW